MKVLVANRGEIAVRLIQGLYELDIESVAIHTASDRLHAKCANHAVELPSAASFMDGELILSIAKENGCHAIVPGYGFLSESSAFAKLCEDNHIVFVGPSSTVLAQLGDKSSAKAIARKLGVPVLPSTAVQTADDVLRFAKEVDFPIMIKAQDGGGGKGIRIVREASEIEPLLQEAKLESPSQQVFAEKAALEGYKHIEVQVIGEKSGKITTVFERECSLQRKFQKVIEIAPSSLSRARVQPLLDAAIKMAQHVKYLGLGTFEFLVADEFYFMECNPRIQVEHTVTEQIAHVDLVHVLLSVCLLDRADFIIPESPQGVSIQCRVNAEDSNFVPSRGTVSTCTLPSGSGIRVDTILSQAGKYEVTDEYDSLLAKVICTANTYPLALKKAQFAVAQLQVEVKTNQSLLLGLLHSDVLSRVEQIDIRTLSQVGFVDSAVSTGSRYIQETESESPILLTSAATPFKKGDQFNYTIENKTSSIKIEKILKNNFPIHLSAQVSINGTSQRLQVEKSTGSLDHRKANPLDKSHVSLPFSGILVEFLVDTGDKVEEGETVAVFRQGKMELDVRSQHAGFVVEVATLSEGEDVGAGALVAVITPDSKARL